MTYPRPTTGHIGLNVTDLDRSIDFYVRILDLKVLGRGEEEGRESAFLGRDGSLVLTLWRQAEEGFRSNAAGLHHLSFEVDTIDEVRTAEARLLELAVEFAYDGVVPHGEGAASGGVFFHDPDGIRLEIYAPSGAESAEAPVASAPTCGFF
ncbi:VOC family protein [Nocardiopsis sp. N85]|uniref:VOC family protein n=1 Tax=Nocardiopsis sp. N85 TaxID=3029400 RepID=UPI00237F2BF3|nr:VOC family protein [Nocardiopsis sp. N85]MDE3720433.1 VOC family protein [Nocardiopsis sp. N85]